MEIKMKYSREEMNEAFSAVQNPKGWKYPIKASVSKDKLDVTMEAIAFFAGSPTFVERVLKSGKVKISAPGYYVCIGA